MSSTVIRVENLSKQFQIGAHSSANRTFREALQDGVTAPFRRAASLLRGQSSGASELNETFWALRDVNFEVQEGEVVGIIGRNGAGKSTLLKILSRITEPTEGRVTLHGRVGSLLEVGTGFHPELTGRENVSLNGAILGMSRREIERKFDEIIAFAEIERFVDTPVKHYSSGMYMRLAFAVAAFLEPEILIVDEVLAVGDAAFQKKCLGKMGDVAKEGRTVLFVSHNMGAVRTLCSRAFVLDQGYLRLTGQVEQAVRAYVAMNQQEITDIWESSYEAVAKPLYIKRVQAALEGQQPNHKLVLRCRIEAGANFRPSNIVIDIVEPAGTSIMQACPSVENYIVPPAAVHEIEIQIDLPPLIPGEYKASVWVGPHNTETYDWAQECVAFEITTSPTAGRAFPYSADHGFVVPKSTYKLVDTSTVLTHLVTSNSH